MTASELPDRTLAGYRLVRRLASGSRADLYLGVGSTASVVLKTFRSTTDQASIDAELDALGRLASQHLVRLLDVSRDEKGVPILVLERVTEGSLLGLIAARAHLQPGEAVTLLSPIANLIGQLHEAGVAHGKLGESSILLGAGGAPVLIGLGHCTLFEPHGTKAEIDSQPAASRDRDLLADLTLRVLATVRGSDLSNRMNGLVSWIQTSPRRCEFPAELAEHLFEFAEALPVPRVHADESGPLRLTPAPAAEPELDVPGTSKTGSAMSGERERPALPAWLPAVVPTLILENPLSLAKTRAQEFVRGIRTRFWIIAGAVTLALIVAIVVVPSSGVPSPRPAAAHAATVSRPRASAAVHVPPVPSDPLAAAAVLLSSRRTCFRTRSILCLDGVDEASSAAFESDAQAIRQLQDGGEVKDVLQFDGAPLTLVERLGDTVLASVGSGTGTPSVLLIKTRAGWRLRDLLTGVQSTPSP